MMEREWQPEGMVMKGGKALDNRQKIEHLIESYPYDCLGLLVCRDKVEDVKTFGTIWIISEWYGLTAAHLMLYTTQRDELLPYSNMEVFPCANGLLMMSRLGRTPAIRVANYRLSTMFYRAEDGRKKSANDFALVKFDSPIKRKAYCKLAKAGAQELFQAEILVPGYPFEKWSASPKGGHLVHLYQGSGRVVSFSVEQSFLTHDVSTSKGQSGSPILLQSQGTTLVIGIHNAFHRQSNVNAGVLFTEQVFRQIYNWIEEMQAPTFQVCLSHPTVRQMVSNQDLAASRGVRMPLPNISCVREVKGAPEHWGLNWAVGPRQKKDFTVRGPSIFQNSPSKKSSMICSHESFPLDQVTTCTVNATFKAQILLGLVTSQHKDAITNQEQRPVEPFNQLSPCYLQAHKNTKGGVEETVRCWSGPELKLPETHLGQKNYRITLKVDTLNKEVSIERNGSRLLSWKVPPNLVKEPMHLCVVLANNADSVQVIT